MAAPSYSLASAPPPTPATNPGQEVELKGRAVGSPPRGGGALGRSRACLGLAQVGLAGGEPRPGPGTWSWADGDTGSPVEEPGCQELTQLCSGGLLVPQGDALWPNAITDHAPWN